MTARPVLLVAGLVLGGCVPSAPDAAEEAYDRREGDAEYRVVQGTEGVLRIEMRIRAGADADLPGLEARCRRAIVVIGITEAKRARMPPPHVVPDAFITANARRDPRTGGSRCIAEAPVFPSGGRGTGGVPGRGGVRAAGGDVRDDAAVAGTGGGRTLMSSHTDGRGLPVSTGSDAAAALYRDGVDRLLSAWTGAPEALDAAIASDPDFALAHAARARAHVMAAEGEAARRRIAAASDLVLRRGTERERSHVAVLSAGIDGRPGEALERTLAHLDRWPRDALILALPLGAFGLFAFSGMADHDRARVDLCDRHAAAYGEDWWFLTYQGWSHTEAGNLSRGRDLSERAFALRRENGNAVHALAHAMFEQGARGEADAFVEEWLPGYDPAAPLHGHISWHQALGALEEGDAARALSIYEARVRPGRAASAPIVVVTDGASLLWRLDAYGHPAPRAMWDEVAASAARHFPGGGPAFVEVHLALLAAATGDAAGVARRVEDLSGRVARGEVPAGPVVPAVCRAALLFAEGDHAGCAQVLEPVLAEVVRLGGSGAQRRMIEDTLRLALMRSGEGERAQALLDRRLHRRPSPRDAAWRASVA